MFHSANTQDANAALAAIENRHSASNEHALRVADEMMAGVRTRGDACVAEQVAKYDHGTSAPAERRRLRRPARRVGGRDGGGRAAGGRPGAASRRSARSWVSAVHRVASSMRRGATQAREEGTGAGGGSWLSAEGSRSVSSQA